MDLIEHVESKLVNIVTTQMKRYWEITFNRWQEIARRVHNQLDSADLVVPHASTPLQHTQQSSREDLNPIRLEEFA